MSEVGAARVSAIVATYNASKTITECLESLKCQPADTILEVIVVDSSTDGTAQLVRDRFPDVKLLRFPERRYCGSARNAAIAVARGDIIAFVDADCTVGPNWAREILQAHQSPTLAIGGAIANGNPHSYVGWAAYFCEFCQWMPGIPPHRSADIAAASMSYKAKAFGKYGGFIERGYCSDTEFHWRLVRGGHPLQFAPSILVYHRNVDSFFHFVRHEYEHGRWFGRMRVKSEAFSRARRFRHVLALPLFTLMLFLGTGARALRGKDYVIPFLKASPLVALGHFSWCCGECVGAIGK